MMVCLTCGHAQGAEQTCSRCGATRWVFKEQYEESLESHVRRLSHAHLGEMPSLARELAAFGPGAVPRLLQALHDEDDTVRIFAAVALGHIGDARAIDPLIRLLGGAGAEGAASALAAMGVARAAGPLRAAMRSDRGPGIGAAFRRGAYARALGQLGDAEAIPLLLEAFSEEEAGVRDEAACALCAIGGQGVSALVAALRGPDRAASRAAAGALRSSTNADARAAYREWRRSNRFSGLRRWLSRGR